jgi:hypothetical protein
MNIEIRDSSQILCLLIYQSFNRTLMTLISLMGVDFF